MKKLILFVLSCLVLTGLVAGCGGDKAADQNNATKKIVIGLDDNFPPMGFKDEKNEIVGFDIDMAKEVSKRLGRDVEFKPIDWSSKEAELKSGRIDVIWNGLNITDERKQNMAFSKPYMEAKQLIFVPTGSPIKGQADLEGKVVGMQSASTAEINLDNDQVFAQTLKEVKKYPDCIAALMDMEAGRVDAIITDEIVGRYYMEKKPGKFMALDEPIGPVGEFGIGFRLDDQALVDAVQKALDEMKAEGVSSKISTKWFKADLVN
ncbi:MAG TPA: amino acid ABC transporter substrate-binding protein [Candidatus Avacidaminococcus intestinavium]|uniref:Amino acid ABC transporter substrate-binding protein n=1 Tax=Candidatus Avacidaminococcus intestinavium TaxID=2840684 RepID=A0A9D1MQD5_9FIRM|nr:amino acid ABC transporter substrate-binding protein [Candidatus Avacidaminococcus intestinavium]